MPHVAAKETGRDHAVQLIFRDGDLAALVGAYLTAAARSGATAVVAATQEHIAAFEGWMRSDGIDVEALRAWARS